MSDDDVAITDVDCTPRPRRGEAREEFASRMLRRGLDLAKQEILAFERGRVPACFVGGSLAGRKARIDGAKFFVSDRGDVYERTATVYADNRGRLSHVVMTLVMGAP